MTTSPVLVAGIGNVFLGDDGFGVEVVRCLAPATLPEGVDVADYGIRGVHLAYDLLERPRRTLILIDAVPLDEPPGTLAVLEVDTDAYAGADAVAVEAHSMTPDVVLCALQGLGGAMPRVLVLGCQPGELEPRMGLCPPVQAAANDAVALLLDLVRAEVGDSTTTQRDDRLSGQFEVDQFEADHVEVDHVEVR